MKVGVYEGWGEGMARDEMGIVCVRGNGCVAVCAWIGTEGVNSIFVGGGRGGGIGGALTAFGAEVWS